MPPASAVVSSVANQQVLGVWYWMRALISDGCLLVLTR
jgi:hypothetical protein